MKALFSDKAFCSSKPKKDQPGQKVNLTVKKDSPKVVDTCDIEEIGEKKVFCRCWRSQKVNLIHLTTNELPSTFFLLS